MLLVSWEHITPCPTRGSGEQCPYLFKCFAGSEFRTRLLRILRCSRPGGPTTVRRESYMLDRTASMRFTTEHFTTTTTMMPAAAGDSTSQHQGWSRPLCVHFDLKMGHLIWWARKNFSKWLNRNLYERLISIEGFRKFQFNLLPISLQENSKSILSRFY